MQRYSVWGKQTFDDVSIRFFFVSWWAERAKNKETEGQASPKKRQRVNQQVQYCTLTFEGYKAVSRASHVFTNLLGCFLLLFKLQLVSAVPECFLLTLQIIMSKDFAKAYYLTIKRVGIVSLFLVVFYEIMWLPIDNYDTLLISNIPTFPELCIDAATCILQTLFCTLAVRYEIRNEVLLKWEHITFPTFITILALYCTILALPITLLQIHIYHLFSIQQWDWQDYFANVMILSLLSCLLIAISLLLQYVGHVKEVSQSREKTLQSVSEAKILALQSQINPHFLFNTLSSAIGYVEYDPKKATKLLLRLSDVYRHILVHRQGNYTTLKEEIDALHNYMELINIRHGNSIELTIKIENEYWQKGVLPCVLQLLSENAIKHNKWSDDNPLHITVTNSDSKLLVISDYRPFDSGISSFGIGQSNVSERYEILGISGVRFYHNDFEYIAEIPLIDNYNI